MPAVELLLNNPAVVALGWTLVHFLWQGCVIALVYWLICSLAPRHAATLRYWAGLAGMLLSVFVILLTFFLSYAPEARFGIESAPATAVNPFLVLAGSVPDAWILLESGLEPVLPWVVVLWLLGVSAACLRTGRDWYAVHSLLKEAIICSEVHLQLALERIKARLGVQLAVRLMVSARVRVPLAVGFLRPVILMPISVLARLPDDQLEMILAHELGHIRRFDYAVNFLQVVLETLLFYHPAIVWMSQRVREEREHCCDDLVVRECGRPATYARALASLEVIRSPTFAAAVPATGGNLLARIRLIIDDSSRGKSSSLWQFALVAFAGILVAFGAQQGYAISNELNRVAYSAQLQTSDVQWKTWGLSREVWGQGVSRYAQSMRKKQLNVLKIESLNLQHLVEPEFDIQAIANLDTHVANPLELEHGEGSGGINLESLIVSADPRITVPITIQTPGEGFALSPAQRPDDAPGFEKPEFLGQQASKAQNPQKAEQLLVDAAESEIKPLKSRPPNYPWRARRQGIEGFVELEFSVDPEGKVTDVEIHDAIPEGVFEKAASKALAKWTFAGSENSSTRFRQVFNFELLELEKVPRSQRPCIATGSRTCGQISPGVFVVWVNSATRRGSQSALN